MQRNFDALLWSRTCVARRRIAKFLLSKIIARRSPADTVQERPA
jgi:hypothetical protein